jgi:hypothetical protein
MLQSIIMKLFAIEFVGTFSETVEFGSNPSARGRRSAHVKYTVIINLFFLFRKPAERMTALIVMRDVSNDAIWSNEVPLGDLTARGKSLE